MDSVYRHPAPKIPRGSSYPDEFLTITEFKEAVSVGNVIAKDGLKILPGNRGRIHIALQDKKKFARDVQIEFKGESQYGISEFTGTSEKKGNSFSIGIDVPDDNSSLISFTDTVDSVVEALIPSKELLLPLYEAGPENDAPEVVFRKAARASKSGSTKTMRVQILPGRVELGPKKTPDVCQSLKEFGVGAPGEYFLVVKFSHIDLVYEDGVISAGPILQAKIVRSDIYNSGKKRKFRTE